MKRLAIYVCALWVHVLVLSAQAATELLIEDLPISSGHLNLWQLKVGYGEIQSGMSGAGGDYAGGIAIEGGGVIGASWVLGVNIRWVRGEDKEASDDKKEDEYSPDEYPYSDSKERESSGELLMVSLRPGWRSGCVFFGLDVSGAYFSLETRTPQGVSANYWNYWTNEERIYTATGRFVAYGAAIAAETRYRHVYGAIGGSYYPIVSGKGVENDQTFSLTGPGVRAQIALGYSLWPDRIIFVQYEVARFGSPQWFETMMGSLGLRIGF